MKPQPHFRPLTPHIWKLDLPLFGGRLPVGVFLVESDGEWTVVDAGASDTTDVVMEQVLATTGGRVPVRLILTHGHYDHGGATRAMWVQWHPLVCAGRAEFPYIVGPRRYRHIRPARLDYILFQMSAPCLLGLNVQRPLDEGMTLAGMEVIDVPGHSPGMIALHHTGDRALIAGDAFVNLRNRLSQPIRVFTADRQAAQRSMARLAALDFDHLIPSHGPAIMGEGKKRAEAVVAKL